MANGSESSIMTVAEMIDRAFGDDEKNVVHHKIIQSVLYLLARQLRILERRVALNIGADYQEAHLSSKLTVSEVKLLAMTKKKSTKPPPEASKAGDKLSPAVDTATKKKAIKKDDKTSTDKTPTDKTPTDKTPTDKTPTDKAPTDKTPTNKTPTDKTPADKTPADKTPADKTPADKTPADKTPADKTPADKTPAYKAPADKTPTDKTSTDKIKSDEKFTENEASSKLPSIKSDETFTEIETSSQLPSESGRKTTTVTEPQAYQELLDKVEQMRERELRVIRQRASSRDEREKTPTPMASLDSVEATYEKLLIVERVPSEEAKIRAAREKSGIRKGDAGSRLSVVTQDQFQELVSVVRKVMQKLGPIEAPGFPENAQLLQDLRKGASLTDAMAALQLSARLEASEKVLQNLLSIVTELAKNTPGIDLSREDNIEVIYGGRKQSISHAIPYAPKESETTERPISVKRKKTRVLLQSALGSASEASVETLMDQTGFESTDYKESMKEDCVTHVEVANALKKMRDEIIKMVETENKQSCGVADQALKKVNQLELQLENSPDIGTRMDSLENLVSDYAEQINTLDTGLSSQMTNYQEELTQMQHDLEMGLESMAEVLANTGGDVTAIAELNSHFGELQTNIDHTMTRQRELKNFQSMLSMDLNVLQKQIELLRETKSDRDEVADALRDKAGLKDLNGLITHNQFEAVRGDIEKRIRVAYDKFNNQEIVWQRAIDDILRDLNEKSDLVQIECLRKEINDHLQVFNSKLLFIMDILGEPNAAALSKRVNRDSACLSCAAPANMKLEENSMPILPAVRPQAIGAEAVKPKEDGDHGVCTPGFQIPHPRDPRSHFCNRWCGGSHTLVNNAKRTYPEIIITPARRVTTTQGTDGKSYAVDEPLKPCTQCKASDKAPGSAPVVVDETENINGDSTGIMSPYFVCPPTHTPQSEQVSVTPPTFYTSLS